MTELLYIGAFKPWTDKNEEELFDALKKFDKVKICVMMKGNKLTKGQPTKIIDLEVKDRVSICKFKKLSNLLTIYKNNKYILFER